MRKGVTTMNKKFTAALATVLTATMVFGTTVMAAPSPSASTTAVKSTATETSAPAEPVNAYIPRGGSYQEVSGVRFSSDYTEVTDNKAVATSYKASEKDAATKALTDYVAAASTSTGKTFGPYKLRMYKAGKSVWDGFGTFKYTVGVGNKYDGQTATVYQIHKDGSVTATQVVVSHGKVTIAVQDMGTFLIQF